MKGLELSRFYYDQWGRDGMKAAFPELFPRMAFGLAGEGSECFGFDDGYSRDHDWGPAFCIWMDEADFKAFGGAVQEAYNALPCGIPGYPPREVSAHGDGRVGVLCLQDWFRRYTGHPYGPKKVSDWRHVPEAFLATATNGAVYEDELRIFSSVRRRLLGYYPEDVRLKKIAARAAVMAQAGQYNYPRCVRRGEAVAAELALAEFIRAGLSMVYLLNRRYAPFYKWMHRGTRDLPVLPRAYGQFLNLAEARDGDEKVERIEGICVTVVAELRRQGLTAGGESFLQAHCQAIMDGIQNPKLRHTHVMAE